MLDVRRCWKLPSQRVLTKIVETPGKHLIAIPPGCNIASIMDAIQRAGWVIVPSSHQHPVAVEALCAWQRIHTAIKQTPLTPVSLPPHVVHIKREDLQHTRSFKARGAINVVLAMTDAQLASGAVTSSTGNHALGCVHAFGLRNDTGRLDVYVPTTTAAVKLERLRALGTNIIMHGQYVI